MAKIFELDFRKGTLIDNVSKNQSTFTKGNGNFKKTEKGYSIYFDGLTTKIDSNITLSDVKTIVLFIKPTDNTTLLLDNGSDKLEITGNNYSGTGLTENYVNNVNSDVAIFNQFQMVESQFSSGINFLTDLEILCDNKTFISRVICFDHLLSTVERNNLYNEFLNIYLIIEQKTHFIYPVPADYHPQLRDTFKDSPVGSIL